jgi:uncharacterized protein YndB with AHSA1/START domain
MEVDRAWFADIRRPLGSVWNALTAEAALGAWFDPGASLQYQTGGRLLAPSGTQFRGKFSEGKLALLQDRQELIFDWPLGSVPTQLVWLLAPTKTGTRLIVNHKVPARSAEILPPRGGEDALFHFWFQNLTCLKYHLETGGAIARAEFARLPEKEVDVSLLLPVTPERLWECFTRPEELDRWVAKKAVVEVRDGGAVSFGWDHGPERVQTFSPRESVSFNWHVRGEETLVTFSIEPTADPVQTRARIRHVGFAPENTSTLYDYHEGWLTLLYGLGLSVVAGADRSWFGSVGKTAR